VRIAQRVLENREKIGLANFDQCFQRAGANVFVRVLQLAAHVISIGFRPRAAQCAQCHHAHAGIRIVGHTRNGFECAGIVDLGQGFSCQAAFGTGFVRQHGQERRHRDRSECGGLNKLAGGNMIVRFFQF
jgi:hypothetical protein